MSSPVFWDHLAQPIQDQGQCGSCVSFGLTGVIEALYKQKYGKDVKLSERDLFFCSGGRCDQGNTMEAPLDHAKNVGIATEECMPYGDTVNGVDHKCGDGRCGEWWVDGIKIASWMKLPPTEVDATLREGPLFMSMAVPQSLMNYVSGIYHSLGVFDPIVGYHAVGCFGKNFEERWVEARNSWGAAGWGEESVSNHIPGERGWFRAEVDDAALELEYYKVVVDGEIPPEPKPTPSPCPVGNVAAKILSLVPRLLRRRGRFYYRNP